MKISTLEMRTCGDLGLHLSALGLGCWSFGGGEYWDEPGQKKHDQQNVNAVVRRAVELGINYFDTAEAYNEGRSEESLGQAIRGLPRESLVIGPMEEILNICLKHKVPFGTTASGIEAAQRWIAQGAQFFEVIDEMSLILQGASKVVRDYLGWRAKRTTIA